MKQFTLFIALFGLFLGACQNTPKDKEPSESDKAAEAMEKMHDSIANAVKISKTSGLLGTQIPEIIGSNVTMRKDASIQSEKIGSFQDKEKVEILESKNVQNEGEAILNKPITLKGSGGALNLPKGKAVMIENYVPNSNTYQVHYEDPKKGMLTAEVDAKAVETIIYATWYNVKRENGETGWVLGKFLKIN